MKALGSGEITGCRVGPALRWAFLFPWIHSLCVGMTTPEELRANVALWRASRK
jgi:aryl-alcohol dehydrogenase-like predicted oxidoreductase